MTANLVNTEFNAAKAEAFAGQLLDVLNAGGLALMVSIGHRTGLFDTLATLPPSTSQDIADARPASGTLRARVAQCHDHRAHGGL
jgi:hypothetical protein